VCSPARALLDQSRFMLTISYVDSIYSFGSG